MARVIRTEVENGKLYEDGLLYIANVRMSYPHLDVPYKGKKDAADKKPGFGIIGLLDKKTHNAVFKLLVMRINEILAENKCAKLAADRKFVRDGDLAGKDECEGMWVVSARETNPPKLRDRAGNALVQNYSEEKGVYVPNRKITDLFIAGHYGNILVRPWWQDSEDWGKRVNAGLVAVQYFKKGEAFSESQISDDDVDEVMGASGEDSGFEDDDASGL